jgi:hypothetical protein
MFFNIYFLSHDLALMELSDKRTERRAIPSRARITTRIIHNSSGEGEGSAPLPQRELPRRAKRD